jgi:hypothetical protein
MNPFIPLSYTSTFDISINSKIITEESHLLQRNICGELCDILDNGESSRGGEGESLVNGVLSEAREQ